MELALAFPYSLGLIAAFNPCGFALLPAYLSYFLGIDPSSKTADDTVGAERQLLATLLRAFAVSITLTVGFIGVFGLFGLLFETVLSQGAILDRIGYVTIGVGVLMLLMGVVLLAGKAINLRLPKMSKGTDSRGLGSVFLFGVSYAVVSLSCTIGLFIASVASSFDDVGFWDGVANFIAYGLGMGSVITFLTMALALARTGVVTRMRQMLRWVNRVSGLMLVLAGAYLMNYGWWELQLRDDVFASNIFVEWFIERQTDLQAWIDMTTPHRLGVLCLLGVAGVFLVGWRQVTACELRRRVVTDAYWLAWLVVEFVFNNGDFLVGPAVRFIAGWPERIGNWFSDPLRFAIIVELGLLVLLGWLVYESRYSSLMQQWQQQRKASPEESESVPGLET